MICCLSQDDVPVEEAGISSECVAGNNEEAQGEEEEE